MPRSNSGTMSLPAGQPVLTGTTINSATFNSLTGDLAQEITDSLSRSGKGGMTAPLRTANGSVSAPSHSFTNDTDTGIYLIGDANPAVTVAGTKRQEWTSAGTAVNGTLEVSGASTLTGVATLSATPVLNAGASVPSGDIALSKTGTQTIAKTNGTLSIEAGGANEVRIAANATTRIILPAAGGVSVEGHVLSNVGTPSADTDAATKAYVDTQVAVGKQKFTVLLDGSNGGLLQNFAGSLTGYVFAHPGAGTYTITKAAGFSSVVSVHVTVQHTAGVSASWDNTSGTVVTIKTSDSTNHNILVTLYDT